MTSRRSTRCIVAIPVKNEASHIQQCLEALAVQLNAPTFEVLLLLNNCVDTTAGIVRTVTPDLPFAVHVLECDLSRSQASAGFARRLATQQAALRVGQDGILLTTDADARVASDWIASNVAALSAGADAVAGYAEIDADDAAKLPPHLHEIEDRVQLLTTLLDKITSLLDPDTADPWPRHAQHSGASIAVIAEVFHRAGGIPAVPCGEDRAFFAALRDVDARIRHCPKVRVVVSGRLHGRAQGGMADTLRRRLVRADNWLDDCLEPTADAVRRAAFRALARRHWSGGPDNIRRLSRALGVEAATVRECLRAPAFGVAWQRLTKCCPLLQRRRIPFAALEHEIRDADTLVNRLTRQSATARETYSESEVCLAGAI